MRVVEPKKYTHQSDDAPKPTTRSARRRLLFIVLLLVTFVSTFVVIQVRGQLQHTASTNITTKMPDNDADEAAEVPEFSKNPGSLREFSGNEFRLLYDNLVLPNTNRVDTPPVITGNDIADTRIRKIAVGRGYKLRSSPTVSLASAQGLPMQEVAVAPWLALQAAAREAGHTISLVSAFRSEEDQRQLFLSRLSAEGVSIEDVANGLADDAINTVLVTTSIPGFSKHHTGYTIDILCAGYEFENFKNSTCHEWLSNDNFRAAKEHGYIPSYPADAGMQGPDPEAWEYVYVGDTILRY